MVALNANIKGSNVTLYKFIDCSEDQNFKMAEAVSAIVAERNFNQLVTNLTADCDSFKKRVNAKIVSILSNSPREPGRVRVVQPSLLFNKSDVDQENRPPVGEEVTNAPKVTDGKIIDTHTKTNGRVPSPLFVDIRQEIPCDRVNPPQVTSEEVIDLTDDSSSTVETPLNSAGVYSEISKLRQYICMYCEELFQDGASIQSHMRVSHSGIQPLYRCLPCDTVRPTVHSHDHNFKCKICGRPFMNLSDCRNHQKDIHCGQQSDDNISVRMKEQPIFSSATGTEYRCFYCSKEFSSFVFLQIHSKSNHYNRIPKFYCFRCNNVFKSVVEHVHQGSSAPKCKICGQVLTNDTERNKHANLYHSKLKTYSKKDSIKNLTTTVKCKMCSETFPNHTDCADHERVCHLEKIKEYSTYKCLHCSENFLLFYEVVDHLHFQHAELVKAKCERLYKSFSLVKSHILIKFICKSCSKCFASAHERSAHELEDHKQPVCLNQYYKANESGTASEDSLVFVCLHCAQQFEEYAKLTYHIESEHSKLNLYRCKKCCRNYSYSEKHVHRIIKCKECDEVFQDELIRNWHFSENHKTESDYYVCLSCNQRFEEYHRLTTHVANDHDCVIDPDYQCSRCNTTFTITNEHIHLDENPVKEDPIETAPSSCDTTKSEIVPEKQTDLNISKTYKVRECRDTNLNKENTISIDNTQGKTEKSLPGTEKDIFSCNDCGKFFFAQDDLEIHKIVHKKSKCGLCNKEFSSMSLQAHKQRHLCAICKKQYNDIRDGRCCENMHLHNKATFKCEMCSMTFLHFGGLSTHVRRQHETGKSFKCSKCNQTFASENNLFFHLQRHLLSNGVKIKDSSNKQ